MQQKLRNLMSTIYLQHLYLLDTLRQSEKEYFYLIEHRLDLSMDALINLSSYLRRYFNRKCIVLIDEYDHPLNVASEHGYYNHARNYFSSLLGSLLKVSILDGCCWVDGRAGSY